MIPNRLKLLILAALAAAVSACGQQPAGAAPSNVITVSEAKASFGTIASVFSYSGSVTPRWTVSVMPKTSGQVTELKVQQGQQVNQADVIAVLDHRSLDDQVAQADANVRSAQAKLNSLLAGARQEDVDAANANVEASKQKLAIDQANLNKLQNGPAQQDVTNAQLAVEAAKGKLYADQTNYDAQVGRGQMTKEQRQSALDVDQTAIDQANTALAKVLAPPRAEDVAAAQAAVAADQQAINAQQAISAKTAKPYTPQDIAQAQAAVDVAQAALRAAQTSLNDATITAPAAGIISDVPVAAGSLVGPSSPIATLISQELEVDSSIEESQVALFRGGEPASISVSALPQKSVDGRVFLVAPMADAKTRKFTVKVEPVAPDSPLRAGMSATVKIRTGEQHNVLLVPKDAVIQRNGQQVVFVDSDGRARMQPVQTGTSDDRNVQVLAGIQAGDNVILPGSVNLADGDAVTPVPAGGG